ncbi:MAG: hypothetical protein ACFFA7_06425 [Promethearchaeota archaeon]
MWKKTAYFFHLILLLTSVISIFLFSTSVLINNNMKILYDNSINVNDLRSSDPDITIITPENRSYSHPMNGYYPATFGFEDEVDGTSRTDIRYVDNTNAIQSNCYVDIQNNYQGHIKVLRVYDGNTAGNAEAQHYFTSNHTSGTIEWWWCTAMGGSGAMWYHFHEGTMGTIAGSLVMANGEFRDMDGNMVQLITTNRWYHHKLTFNTALDTYDWYIDNVLMVHDGNFTTPVSNIGSTIIKGSWANNGSCYVDAISYSWDPDYTLGDNLNVGLLLSFDTSFTPDWLGYSLDEQTIRTIFGNYTFPYPLVNGKHSIQVFGNNTIGTMYQSDIRYFTIGSSPTIPPGIPGFDVLLILGTLSITSGILIKKKSK